MTQKSRQRLDDLRATELLLSRLRWSGIALLVLQFALTPGPGGGPLPWPRWPVTAAIAVLFAALNVVAWVATRRADERVLRRVGLGILAGDGILLSAVLVLFAFEFDSGIWALQFPLVLEAALRAGRRGALLTWLAMTVVYVAVGVVYAAASGIPVEPDSVIFRSGMALLVAASVGALVHRLEEQRDQGAELTEQLAYQATHDAMTGLANRALFVERLRQALKALDRHPSTVGVLFVDLDRFKVVNDSLGHAAGDDLLVQVAGRLDEIVRAEDTVARFGGDEFTILCPRLESTDEAVALAERIASALDPPVRLESGELHVTGSVGIAVTAAADATPTGLLRDADIAMYAAKERGRNRFVLFDEAMRSRAIEVLDDTRRPILDFDVAGAPVRPRHSSSGTRSQDSIARSRS